VALVTQFEVMWHYINSTSKTAHFNGKHIFKTANLHSLMKRISYFPRILPKLLSVLVFISSCVLASMCMCVVVSVDAWICSKLGLVNELDTKSRRNLY